ncbi:hypothetical protein E2C01_061698 [Portunus trituberculatus]|uniref:Uncharacterized protein n=1 Tax=Portunus trituberculatus TaxID=210409 RepID=A0A5B7H4K0_PORTR|nr:hypothetical protein [Portunus trituberculatus]
MTNGGHKTGGNKANPNSTPASLLTSPPSTSPSLSSALLLRSRLIHTLPDHLLEGHSHLEALGVFDLPQRVKVMALVCVWKASPRGKESRWKFASVERREEEEWKAPRGKR